MAEKIEACEANIVYLPMNRFAWYFLELEVSKNKCFTPYEQGIHASSAKNLLGNC